jgi:hypothetical protein
MLKCAVEIFGVKQRKIKNENCAKNQEKLHKKLTKIAQKNHKI